MAATITTIVIKNFAFIGLILCSASPFFGIDIVNGQICEANCQRGIDQALTQSSDYHTKLTKITDDLNTKILKLGNEEAGIMAEVKSVETRVYNLEQYLPGNVSSLTRRIDDEVAIFYTSLSDQLDKLQKNLTRRIDDLAKDVNALKEAKPAPAPGTGTPSTGTTPQDVYSNLTKRIDGLEFGKIKSLIGANDLWRKNFKVVNNTFQRLKRCNC